MEKKAKVVDLNAYGVPALLDFIGWGKILAWSGDTYSSFAFGLYESITHTTLSSFTIRLTDGELVVDARCISSVMGIPLSNGPEFVANVLSLDDRDNATTVIRGRAMKWSRNSYLPASSLLPVSRIIHIIFTHSIYPRKEYRIEITPYMRNILSKVATGVWLCFPSIIL